jgi:hypothetical protein
MPWTCLHCHETSEDDFAVCWRCGATRDGRSDPAFEHADDYEPPLPEEPKAQFSLGRLLTVITALCMVFGLTTALVNNRLTFSNFLLSLTGLAAIVFLSTVVGGWLFARIARRVQTEIRADVRMQRERLRGRECGPTGPPPKDLP